MSDFKQVSLADVFDNNEIPIGLGEYVEHRSKPGVILEIVSEPYTTQTGKVGVEVKDPQGWTYPVVLEYLKRYKKDK